MMNKLWALKNRKNKRGFTLIELIIVIAILAILMMIAIPAMSSYINTSKEATANANARTAYGAVMAATSSEPFNDLHSTTFKNVAELKSATVGSGFDRKVGELLGDDFVGRINYTKGADDKVIVKWKEEKGDRQGQYPPKTK